MLKLSSMVNHDGYYFIVGTPQTPFIKGVSEFYKFLQNVRDWGADFSHKKGGVGKIVGHSFKKGRYHLFSY